MLQECAGPAACTRPPVPGITAPPRPQRVAVFRALQLGDLLCAVPALRALRTALPDAEITLIGLPWASEFARRFRRYIDRFMEFPGAPGLVERTPLSGEYAAFIAAARARHFDLALQLHGDGSRSNAVVRALGARYTLCCHPPGAGVEDPRYSLAYPEHLPEIRRLLAPLLHAGIADCGEQLEFPVERADEAALDAVWPERRRHPYICLHPGARLLTRRWPSGYFAAIADACTDAGFVAVLTGSADERAVVDAVLARCRRPCIDLCGRTRLGPFAALLRDARLVVCNDTGTSHITAAVGTPSVVLYSGSEPGRWAPLDTQRHRRALVPVACRPCYHRHCPVGHLCAVELTPEVVWRYIEDALAAHPAGPARRRPCTDCVS